MKFKIWFVLAITCIAITACSGGDTSGEQTKNSKTEVNEKQILNENEFDEMLNKQPLSVSETKYIEGEGGYIYTNDNIKSVIVNKSNNDIKNAVIAYVGWDENNLPVKIEEEFDWEGGSYVRECNLYDINLVGGGTYEDEIGIYLSDGCRLAKTKAIAVSFTTFEDEIWENPYYKKFCEMYEGKKYSEDLTVEIDEIFESEIELYNDGKDSKGSKNTAKEEVKKFTADELEKKLSEQPITIESTNYIVQSEDFKELYPDMLQVILKNNSDTDIKDAVVAFAAWDSNNLPIKIAGQFDIMGDDYIKKVDYSGVNMVAGGSFGENSGYSLGTENNISSFKAIVVSYEDFDGNIWNNPYYEDFCKLYEGKKLS